eukprot:166918-Chlamydomonas_euryale.AAC.1
MIRGPVQRTYPLQGPPLTSVPFCSRSPRGSTIARTCPTGQTPRRGPTPHLGLFLRQVIARLDDRARMPNTSKQLLRPRPSPRPLSAAGRRAARRSRACLAHRKPRHGRAHHAAGPPGTAPCA